MSRPPHTMPWIGMGTIHEYHGTITYSPLFSALGQCSDLKMLEEIFDYGAVQGKIRDQDLDGLFSGTQMAPMVCCQHFAWDFFKNNVPLLLKKYGSVNNTMFLHCMQSTASGFCSSAMADEVTVGWGEFGLCASFPPPREIKKILLT